MDRPGSDRTRTEGSSDRTVGSKFSGTTEAHTDTGWNIRANMI